MFVSQLLRRKQSSQNTSDFWDWKLPPRFYSSPSTNPLTYNQNAVKGYFWTLLMCWIRPSSPFGHSSSHSCATIQTVADFWGCHKIPAVFIVPPPPLSTTIRKFIKVGSGPIWCAESSCGLHLSIVPLVIALQAKLGPIFEHSECFYACTPTTTFNYSQTFFQGGV